jgi:hypothetical protein
VSLTAAFGSLPLALSAVSYVAPTLSQKARKDGTANLRHRETNESVRVCGTVDGQPFLSNFLIAPDEVKKAGLENETGLDL